MRSLCLSLAVALLVASCSHPDESTLPLHAPGPFAPVVTGLRITGPAGPEQIAVWGVPSDPVAVGVLYAGGGERADSVIPGWIPGGFAFYNAYPNPAEGALALRFALPRRSSVDLWVVRARWIGSPNSDPVSLSGATIPAPANGAIRTLLHGVEREAGSYLFIWDGRDDDGGAASSGFYRVYLRADQFVSWRDVLLYHSPDELPGDLRNILHR